MQQCSSVFLVYLECRGCNMARQKSDTKKNRKKRTQVARKSFRSFPRMHTFSWRGIRKVFTSTVGNFHKNMQFFTWLWESWIFQKKLLGKKNAQNTSPKNCQNTEKNAKKYKRKHTLVFLRNTKENTRWYSSHAGCLCSKKCKKIPCPPLIVQPQQATFSHFLRLLAVSTTSLTAFGHFWTLFARIWPFLWPLLRHFCRPLNSIFHLRRL